jgi:hypothetical protein
MRAHRFIMIPAAACTRKVKTYASVSPIIIQTKGGKGHPNSPQGVAKTKDQSSDYER